MEKDTRKFWLFCFSITLTGLLMYFSVPKFIKLELYHNLEKRIDAWNESPTTPNKPNNGNNNGNNNSNNENSNNNNGSNSNNNNNGNNNSGNNNGNNNNGNNSNNENNNNNNENNNPTDNPTNPPVEQPPEEEQRPEETPSGEKIFKVTFFANGADSIEKQEESCKTTGDSCEITLPSISRNNGTSIGWSLNANAIDGYAQNSKYTLTKNQYLYAITKKAYSANFDSNGASLSYNKVSCEVFNSRTSCSIAVPSITRKSGVGIGFSENKDATQNDFSSTIELSSDKQFYAISKASYSANFEANGAFSIGSTILGCVVWNVNNSCNVTAPNIEKDSYTSIGWNTSSESNSSLYNIGSNISLSQNSTFYAIRKIDESGFLTNNAFQGLNLINSLRASKGKRALVWSKSLEFSAELRVNEVISYPVDHKRPNGTDFYTANDLAYGENWTQSYSNAATEMHNLFVNSPTHLANLLNDKYTRIGIAVKYNSKDKLFYWVELFG